MAKKVIVVVGEQHHAVDKLPDNPAHSVADHVHVAGKAGHQVAGAVGAVESLILLLHVFIEIPAQVVYQLLGHVLIGHDGKVSEACAEQSEPYEDCHHDDEVADGVLRHRPGLLEGAEDGVHNAGGYGGVAQCQHCQHDGGA